MHVRRIHLQGELKVGPSVDDGHLQDSVLPTALDFSELGMRRNVIQHPYQGRDCVDVRLHDDSGVNHRGGRPLIVDKSADTEIRS